VAEIAAQVGIHLNTVRFHLARLEDDGIIEGLLGESSGPGRPPVVYRARRGQALGGVRRYRVLAEILLSHLAATGDAPAAESAGRAWGAHLVGRPSPNHEVDRADALERLTALLAELDFAPETPPTPAAEADATDIEVPGAEAAHAVSQGADPDPGCIRLRHCPFLELADPHRHLVCAMHLGLMRGALAELRAPVTVTELEPFAEPTACLAHVAPVPA
jgi:predicted ArsR family transcriptional regulator